MCASGYIVTQLPCKIRFSIASVNLLKAYGDFGIGSAPLIERKFLVPKVERFSELTTTYVFFGNIRSDGINASPMRSV